MNKTHSTRAQFILSMAVFGTIALFVREIALPSAEIALFRAVLAMLLLGGYLLCKKINPMAGIKRRDLLLLLLSGTAMGFNWILLFEAYRHTTVSLSTLCYYFAPVLLTLLSPLLFGERMRPKAIVCFACSTLGVVLIVGVSTAGGGNHFLGVLFGLGAAVLYATVMLLNKSIRSVSGLSRTFLQFVAAVAVLLPYVAFTGGFHLAALNTRSWIFLLIVGLVHTGLTYCLYFSALWRLSGQQAALLSYIDPLVAVLLSVTLLGEPITPLQIVGGVLILGFSILNEISFKNE